MKFTTSKESLNNVMAKMAAVSPVKTTSNSLLNVKIDVNDSIKLSATDNDIYISEEVEFIDIIETGTILIPCKRFFNIIKDIRGKEITLSVKGGKAFISSDKSKYWGQVSAIIFALLALARATSSKANLQVRWTMYKGASASSAILIARPVASASTKGGRLRAW